VTSETAQILAWQTPGTGEAFYREASDPATSVHRLWRPSGALQRRRVGAGGLPDDVVDPNNVANRSEMSRAVTRALAVHRVGHVVLASSIGADFDHGVGPVAGPHELEELLFGLEDTSVLSLRAAFHMENLLASVPLIKEQKINGSAIKADHRFPMIATVDVAERAAAHLSRRDFTGHTVETILGPEDLSMNEATRALGAVLGFPTSPTSSFPRRE
jgi:uncharacterized protein YbjT (DUF2867 family)